MTEFQDIVRAHEEASLLMKHEAWDELLNSDELNYESRHEHITALIDLVREMKPYVDFSHWVFQQCIVTGGDICGGDVQDKMLEMNLLIEDTYSHEEYADVVDASLFEEGDPVYFFKQALLDRLEGK